MRQSRDFTTSFTPTMVRPGRLACRYHSCSLTVERAPTSERRSPNLPNLTPTAGPRIMSITSRPKNPTVGTVAKEAECPHSNAFGPSWEFRCEPAPDRAGHCDRSRRHQPGGVRLDLLDADGEAYARAET